MAAAYPSGSNVFVPTFEASGRIIEQYSRNPKDFNVNKYVTLTPVTKRQGYYLSITAEEAARILTTDLSEFVWHDGNDAPSGKWGLEKHEFKPYETTRYAFPYQIGYLMSEQADWELLASHAAIHAQKAMTARTLSAITALTTSANYDASHVDTATNWGGGFLGAGTPTNPILMNALNSISQTIHQDTLGAVNGEDLLVVIPPDVAKSIAASQEFHAYLKESPFAQAQIRGDAGNFNKRWGLPEQIYGYTFIVEDAVRVSSKKGATKSVGYVWSNKALVLARPGGLVTEGSGSAYSTGHFFSFEEMTVESRDDPNNRRHDARVVDDYDFRVVAPASGVIVTAAIS